MGNFFLYFNIHLLFINSSIKKSNPVKSVLFSFPQSNEKWQNKIFIFPLIFIINSIYLFLFLIYVYTDRPARHGMLNAVASVAPLSLSLSPSVSY